MWIQWQDDRLRNEFTLTETFDLSNAVTFAADRKSCIFQYRTHLVQSILGFVETGKRRHPYALPYPCNMEHSIEMETSGIVGKAMPTIIKRGSAFPFSREGKKRGTVPS